MLHPKVSAFAAGLTVSAAATVQAAPVIDVGTIELFPDTPDQQVELFVTGGDLVQGINLFVQVEDGGPELADLVPGLTGIPGPAVTGVDLITGTIFEDSNLGQNAIDEETMEQIPQLTLQWVETDPNVDTGAGQGFVEAEGLLATLTFDTTGFATIGEEFDLRLVGTVNGDSTFSGNTDSGSVETQISNGTLVIVPVPEPAGLGALAVCGLLLGRRRRI